MREDPRFVEFFGGVANGATILVPFPPDAVWVPIVAPYGCGHAGRDVYWRSANIALLAYHVPAPEHLAAWRKQQAIDDGEEWKGHDESE